MINLSKPLNLPPPNPLNPHLPMRLNLNGNRLNPLRTVRTYYLRRLLPQQESSRRLSRLTTIQNPPLANHFTLSCVSRLTNIVIWEIMACGEGKSMLRIGGPRSIGKRWKIVSMRLLQRRERDRLEKRCKRCKSFAIDSETLAATESSCMRADFACAKELRRCGTQNEDCDVFLVSRLHRTLLRRKERRDHVYAGEEKCGMLSVRRCETDSFRIHSSEE